MASIPGQCAGILRQFAGILKQSAGILRAFSGHSESAFFLPTLIFSILSISDGCVEI